MWASGGWGGGIEDAMAFERLNAAGAAAWEGAEAVNAGGKVVRGDGNAVSWNPEICSVCPGSTCLGEGRLEPPAAIAVAPNAGICRAGGAPRALSGAGTVEIGFALIVNEGLGLSVPNVPNDTELVVPPNTAEEPKPTLALRLDDEAADADDAVGANALTPNAGEVPEALKADDTGRETEVVFGTNGVAFAFRADELEAAAAAAVEDKGTMALAVPVADRLSLIGFELPMLSSTPAGGITNEGPLAEAAAAAEDEENEPVDPPKEGLALLVPERD